MFALSVLLLLSVQSVPIVSTAERSAQYLQETIETLKLKTLPKAPAIKRAYGDFPANPAMETAAVEKADKVPTLHLTKSELAEIYENAVHKGETIKLDPGDGSNNQITAAVHELDAMSTTKKGTRGTVENGFYYYYYPLKSFMDEMSSSAVKHENIKQPNYINHRVPTAYYGPEKQSHVYSHTHQHNVHIEPLKHAMELEKKKGMEPLFMAISGFIGMTVMFVLSMLVLPKFSKLKPKGFMDSAQENMISMTKVALQAIEGYDCSERILCDTAKAAKAFHMYNNRFVRLIRRMGPKSLAKHIDKIGKYTDKKYKCATIACKPK